MGHEVVVYGCIECPGSRATGDYRLLQTLNRSVLRRLPVDDADYPRVTRALFTLPSDALTYRAQLIHLGCTDDPYQDQDVPRFVHKFEGVLRTLYCEIRDEVLFAYRATNDALTALHCPSPAPVTDWTRDEYRGTQDAGLVRLTDPGQLRAAPWWRLGQR